MKYYIKKNISIPSIHYNNPTYVKYPTGISYETGYYFNPYNIYNATYNNSHENFYYFNNNPIYKIRDNFTRTLSYSFSKKNNNNNQKNDCNNNTFNYRKINNNINNCPNIKKSIKNSNNNNILYNSINNMTNNKIHKSIPNAKLNSIYYCNCNYNLENNNNFTNTFNGVIWNKENFYKKGAYSIISGINYIDDYFNEDYNIRKKANKKKDDLIDKKLFVQSCNNSENKNRKLKKIIISNGSAYIPDNGRIKNFKYNNTFYISNPNKIIKKLGTNSITSKNDSNENQPQLNNKFKTINNEEKLSKIKENKTNKKQIKKFKSFNYIKVENKNYIMYKPSIQDDKPSVNSQNLTTENHNIKQNSHNNKNKDKSADEKNNETKSYKKLKKNNIIRKKINLNLLSEKLSKIKIKRTIDTVNKSNNKTSISHLSTKQNSRNASEKVIKSISHSNNFMVTINTSKSKDIQTKEKKQNLKFSINKTSKNNIPIGKKSKKECELCHTLVDSYLYRIHYMSHPTRILKFLYLGNFTHATKIEELKKLGINYILNCASECYNINLPEDIKELHLMIRDYEDFELFDYFEKANQFINKCKSMGGKCLVHCKLGISRSAAFVIAYLIKYTKLGVDEAFNYIKNKRITIKPNDGFMRQLYLYEKISKKNNSEN